MSRVDTKHFIHCNQWTLKYRQTENRCAWRGAHHTCTSHNWLARSILQNECFYLINALECISQITIKTAECTHFRDLFWFSLKCPTLFLQPWWFSQFFQLSSEWFHRYRHRLSKLVHKSYPYLQVCFPQWFQLCNWWHLQLPWKLKQTIIFTMICLWG